MSTEATPDPLFEEPEELWPERFELSVPVAGDVRELACDLAFLLEDVGVRSEREETAGDAGAVSVSLPPE